METRWCRDRFVYGAWCRPDAPLSQVAADDTSGATPKLSAVVSAAQADANALAEWRGDGPLPSDCPTSCVDEATWRNICSAISCAGGAPT